MPLYTSYVLRVWRTQRGRNQVWRAMLERVSTGERVGFTDLPSLVTFLQADFELQDQIQTGNTTTRKAKSAEETSKTGGYPK